MSFSIKYIVFRVGSEYNFIVSLVIFFDVGVYECRVTNVIDTSIDSIRFDVLGSEFL